MACRVGSSLPMANDSALYAALNEVQKHYAYVHPYLAAFICVTGVFMNVASVVVLTRPSMIVSPINCLLTVIAVCDAVTMLSCFNYLVRLLTFPNCPSKFTYEWIVTVLLNSNLTVVCHTVSIWLTVSMAVIRACTVKKAWGGAVRASNAVTLTVFISVPVFFTVCLLNTPSALTYTIESRSVHLLCPQLLNASAAYNSTNAAYLYTTTISALAKRDGCRILKAAFWINGVLFKMLPCVLLTVFIGVLIFILAEVRRRRKRLRLASESNKTDKTTLMLIVLLTVFLMSELPQGLLLIGTGIYDYRFRSRVLNKLGDLMDILSLINSAANFVIYFAMSQKFRQVFCRTLLPVIGDYRIIYTDNRLTFYATDDGYRTTNGVGSHRPSACSLRSSRMNSLCPERSRCGRDSFSLFERSNCGRNSLFDRRDL